MMPGTAPAAPLRVLLVDGARLSLTIGAVGRDWIAGELDGGAGGSYVVPVAAISACFPDTAQAAASTGTGGTGESAVGSLASRLGLPFVLRDLCRRRAPVHLSTRSEHLHGTIDRVARDHLDLAEHEPGVARRDAAVRGIRMLPLSEIVLVRFSAG
jgi:hypothetical protein